MPGYGGKQFDPIKFDGAAPPAPDVTDGAYRLKITSVEVSATNPKPNDATAYPMLVMTYEAVANLEPKGSLRFKMAEGSVGGEVTDRVTFFPEEKRGKGRMGKMRYQELCNIFNLDFRIVPLELEDETSFHPFIEAVTGQELDGWVKNEPDRQDSFRTWPRLFLQEPNNWGDNEEGVADAGDAEPDPDPETGTESGDELEPNDLEAGDGGEGEPAEEPDPEPEPPPPPVKRTAVKTAAPKANGTAAKPTGKPAATPTRAATPAKPAAKPTARR